MVNDKPVLLKPILFVDSEFAGESDSSRSTSGGWLVLAGPNTCFPLFWVCRGQTNSFRSSTEAEVVAFAESFFSEAVPVLDLWEVIL